AVDTSVISEIGAQEAAGLRQHLAADPRWRVTTWDGATQAFERHETGPERAVPWHGFRDRRTSMLRVAIRCEPWPEEAVWSHSPLLSRANGGLDDIRLRGFVLPAPWVGWLATAVAVEGPHLAFDIYEAEPTADRSQTVH